MINNDKTKPKPCLCIIKDVKLPKELSVLALVFYMRSSTVLLTVDSVTVVQTDRKRPDGDGNDSKHHRVMTLHHSNLSH